MDAFVPRLASFCNEKNWPSCDEILETIWWFLFRNGDEPTLRRWMPERCNTPLLVLGMVPAIPAIRRFQTLGLDAILQRIPAEHCELCVPLLLVFSLITDPSMSTISLREAAYTRVGRATAQAAAGQAAAGRRPRPLTSSYGCRNGRAICGSYPRER